MWTGYQLVVFDKSAKEVIACQVWRRALFQTKTINDRFRRALIISVYKQNKRLYKKQNDYCILCFILINRSVV